MTPNDMAEAMVEYQKMLDDNIAKYEDMVIKAQKDLEALVQAATPQLPKPPQPPEAEWTEANGNKFLVLNVAAAEFFTAIFQQLGVVAAELGKLNQKK